MIFKDLNMKLEKDKLRLITMCSWWGRSLCLLISFHRHSVSFQRL